MMFYVNKYQILGTYVWHIMATWFDNNNMFCYTHRVHNQWRWPWARAKGEPCARQNLAQGETTANATGNSTVWNGYPVWIMDVRSALAGLIPCCSMESVMQSHAASAHLGDGWKVSLVGPKATRTPIVFLWLESKVSYTTRHRAHQVGGLPPGGETHIPAFSIAANYFYDR